MPEKFYITTAIDYINGPPHIGHAWEKVIADAICRLREQEGKKTLFVTGTDENGQKNARKAEELGISPQELADRNSSLFQEMDKLLEVEYDIFIRTSDREKHWPGAQKLWEEMTKNGDVYQKEYEGYYCVGCENFVTEKDLVDGVCPEHLKPPERLHREINYFFKRTKYLGTIQELIEKGEILIIPEKRKNEVLKILEEGLEDLSISRPKERLRGWGIPVPGDPSQLMYVWVDALSNYLSAIGYGRDEEFFQEWWPADLHVIGKGILRFHAIDWIAFLLSAKLPLPKAILVHDYVVVEGQKISKSLGNEISPIELAKEWSGVAVRYFLLREGSLFEDLDFRIDKMLARYEGELQHGIGNLVQRTIGIARKKNLLSVSSVSHQELWELRDKARAFYDSYEFYKGIEIMLELVKKGDVFIDKTRLWEREGKELQEGLGYLWQILEIIAELLYPILPSKSKELSDLLVTKELSSPLFPPLSPKA